MVNSLNKTDDRLIFHQEKDGLTCTMHRWYFKSTYKEVTSIRYEYEFIAKFMMRMDTQFRAIILRSVKTNPTELDKKDISFFLLAQLKLTELRLIALQSKTNSYIKTIKEWYGDA